MSLLQALNWRYAVREFNNTRIPETLINTLLEATRLSPSSYGLQPYRLALVRPDSLRARLLTHSYGQEKVLRSSHLVVLAAETDIGDHTVERYVEALCESRQLTRADIAGYVDHMKSALAAKTQAQRQQWACEQAYIALGNLLTSAALLGIDACPMTGFDAAGYDRELDFAPLGLHTVAIVALGERSPEDHSATQAKVRRPRESFVLEY